MKHRKLNNLIFMITIGGLLFGSTACEKSSEKTVSAAILIGNHDKSKCLNYNDADLKSLISEVIYSYGQIYVVSADGDPNLAIAYDYNISDKYKGAAKSKLKSDADQKATMLLSEIVNVKADNEELDDLEGLRLCVRSLAGAPGDKKIYIMDTMLSTTGILNFKNNLLNAEPKLIADELAAKRAIPDFSSIEVTLCLGDTADPQKKLLPDQRIKLMEIWKTIVEKGNGHFVYKEALSVSDSNENLPNVSIIDVAEEDPIAFDPLAVNVLDENQIKFEGNTTIYASPESYIEAKLKPVADYIKRHPQYSILLMGTTATGEENFCQWLSNARAETVKKTLVGMDVSPSQIITKGGSFHDKWHLPDLNENGLLIEEKAKQNRKVVIMDATSAQAKEILQQIS